MRFLSTLLIAFFVAAGVKAQCPEENTAFKSGETLVYNLFFNWKFIWINAGTATLSTRETIYNGEPAFKAHLITKSSKRIDRIFMMRDTLSAVVSPNLVPLFYSKHASEGGDYHTDDVWYSYKDGMTTANMKRLTRKGERRTADFTSAECIYDMLSMMLRARSFDASKFKKGDRIPFIMTDNGKCERKEIVYRGKENFKMQNSTSTTYRCLVFSFVEQEDGKEEEIIRFFITDDKNHLPVRLDMYLNFGIAKAFLNMASGVRNPETARIK